MTHILKVCILRAFPLWNVQELIVRLEAPRNCQQRQEIMLLFWAAKNDCVDLPHSYIRKSPRSIRSTP